MEILTSGSFINLENQEKIEQLKFTATELANAAIETDGFVNDEEPAQKLALEFWQGLEYLCRETEEPAVKNIFVDQFLTRLRELRVSQSPIESDVPDETKEKAVEPDEIKIAAEDEFLGVVENEESDEKEIDQPEITSPEPDVFSITENAPATEADSEPADEFADEMAEDNPPAEMVEEVEREQDQAVTGTVSTLTNSVTGTQVLEKPVTAIASLPEKEPYQWGKCTVTIVVQMLPIEDNSMVRKAVLSVKTHDFVPQISLVELSANNLSTALAPEIEKAAAKYQSDLPVRVMDKLKKEKAAPRKHQPKPTSEIKPASPPPSAKTDAAGSSQPAASESSQAKTTNPSVAAAPPKVETGLQGSLF